MSEGARTVSVSRGPWISRSASFDSRMYVPSGAILILVGDITLENARRLADETLGRWASRATSANAIVSTIPNKVSSARVILVDRPGASQSGIVAGRIGPGAEHSDYFAMLLLNRVLGVGTSSRLNRSLREQHGFTYGVTSFLEARHKLNRPGFSGDSVS